MSFIISFFGQLFRRFTEHKVPDLAAQLSFYFLLALFPFLIFTFALLGYLPIPTDDVLELISQYAPQESMSLIENNLRNVLDVQRGGLLSFSIIFTLWSASNGSYAIIRALNHAYEVEESRPFFRARAVSFFLTFSMILAIIVALILPVFGKAIGLFLFSFVGLSETFLTIWNVLRWIISFCVIVTVFAFLYYFAPNKKIGVREVWIGAIIATSGWELVSLAFSYYVSNFANFTATYGSLGGIIVLMLWLFLSGMILILGGEINALLNQKRKGAVR
jgi:membrane protein